MKKERTKIIESRTTLVSYTGPGHLGSSLEIKEGRVA